ncbi:hypothetical protein D3C73_823350 [compost metagenome]
MNICSVRHSPIPSAPKLLALTASSGVSALVKTLSPRNSSAHCSNSLSSVLISGSLSVTPPEITRPVDPSSVIQSPSRTITPPAVKSSASSSIRTSSQPHTHDLPIPRATTAAWLVIPPRLVSTPSAAMTP